jgi:hypothetical protein
LNYKIEGKINALKLYYKNEKNLKKMENILNILFLSVPAMSELLSYILHIGPKQVTIGGVLIHNTQAILTNTKLTITDFPC